MCEFSAKCWRYWYSVEFRRKPYEIPPTREELFYFHAIPPDAMHLKKSLYCECMPCQKNQENMCPFMLNEPFENCHEYKKEKSRLIRISVKKFPGQEKRLAIPVEVRRSIAARYNYQCVYCGKYQNSIDETGDKVQIVIDHFVPLALGGHPTDSSNLVAACRKCNREKGTEIWEKGCRREKHDNER